MSVRTITLVAATLLLLALTSFQTAQAPAAAGQPSAATVLRAWGHVGSVVGPALAADDAFSGGARTLWTSHALPLNGGGDLTLQVHNLGLDPVVLLVAGSAFLTIAAGEMQARTIDTSLHGGGTLTVEWSAANGADARIVWTLTRF